MTSIFGWLLAWLAPTVAGALLWSACLGRPRGFAPWCAAIGTGYLIGAMGLGAALSAIERASADTVLIGAGLGLALVSALAGVSTWRSGRVVSLATHHAGAPESLRIARVVWVVGTGLATLAVLLLIQDLLLPTLGWDAWNSWLAKPKAWFHNGALVPAMSVEAWGASASGTALTSSGWPYPEALPRYALWLSLGLGAWDESSLHLAWFGCWLALGASLYGYSRLAQIGVAQAALATGALLTLPMVTAHVALAGYADLWLAAMVLLTGVHAYRWSLHGGWRDAVAALACAALLPMIKAEGAVWLLCLVASTALGKVRLRLAAMMIVAIVVVWASALPWGGVRLPLPGLGWARIGSGEIEIPQLGKIALAWQSVGSEVLQTLFLLPNWSLLWYVAPLVVWQGWRAIPGQPAMRMLTWFVTLSLAFLSVLFFFTDASAWAENFTSVNRVLMHAVPAIVFWLSLLWMQRASRDTTRSSAG